MIPFLDPLRDITFVSVAVRLLLAVLCGGVIGLERTYKRRPAGFRTHILICLGAAMTTMTSEYLILYMHYATDITRMGAQVIAGIGFIGAGTIIVTRRQRVKGLTTAAGFWASAIIGLATGVGYFEGAIVTTILIVIIELAFAKLEYWIVGRNPEVSLYLECEQRETMRQVLDLMQNQNIKVHELEISQVSEDGTSSCAVMGFRLPGDVEFNELQQKIQGIEGVYIVEEL